MDFIQVPVFDGILADLGDSQSLQQSLSTFSGHMSQVNNIVRACGPGSLVLLDELGSGTDPSEGAALAIAILRRLSNSVRPVATQPSLQSTAGWLHAFVTLDHFNIPACTVLRYLHVCHA